MEKITKRELILRFVESKESATFSEIQEFIVDLNLGKGTYQEKEIITYYSKCVRKTKLARKWRGYYSDSLANHGNLKIGENRLEKQPNGKYITIRNKRKTLIKKLNQIL